MRSIPNNRLRELARDVLGVDYDALPPNLRVKDIVRGKASPGLLPFRDRAFYDLVRQGVIPPPVKFGHMSTWPKATIVRLAIEGLPREPGHGRKLAGEGVAAMQLRTERRERKAQSPRNPIPAAEQP